MPRSTRNLDHGRTGFIYLLTNPTMPGLVKIGATRKHPVQRAKELGAGTGVAEPFSLAYYRDFADCFLAETLLHEHFAAQRLSEAREFFAVSVSEAIQYVNSLPSRTEYRDQLASEGIVGGTPVERDWDPAPMPRAPFAELFASFDPNGPDELTPAEQAQCRALEARERRRRL